jgi:hypothetical protein
MNAQKSTGKKSKAEALTAGLALPRGGHGAQVSESDAAAFVVRRAAAHESETAARPAPRRERRKLDIKKDCRRLNAYVLTGIVETLERRCFDARISLSQAVTEAIEIWLKQPAAK